MRFLFELSAEAVSSIIAISRKRDMASPVPYRDCSSWKREKTMMSPYIAMGSFFFEKNLYIITHPSTAPTVK